MGLPKPDIARGPSRHVAAVIRQIIPDPVGGRSDIPFGGFKQQGAACNHAFFPRRGIEQAENAVRGPQPYRFPRGHKTEVHRCLGPQEDIASCRDIDPTCCLDVEVISQDHFDELHIDHGAQGHRDRSFIHNALEACRRDAQGRTICADGRDHEGCCLAIHVLRRADRFWRKSGREWAQVCHDQTVANLELGKAIARGEMDLACEGTGRTAGGLKTHQAVRLLAKRVQGHDSKGHINGRFTHRDVACALCADGDPIAAYSCNCIERHLGCIWRRAVHLQNIARLEEGGPVRARPITGNGLACRIEGDICRNKGAEQEIDVLTLGGGQ